MHDIMYRVVSISYQYSIQCTCIALLETSSARMFCEINTISHFLSEGSPVIIPNLVGIWTNTAEIDIVGRINGVNDARCRW